MIPPQPPGKKTPQKRKRMRKKKVETRRKRRRRRVGPLRRRRERRGRLCPRRLVWTRWMPRSDYDAIRGMEAGFGKTWYRYTIELELVFGFLLVGGLLYLVV